MPAVGSNGQRGQTEELRESEADVLRIRDTESDPERHREEDPEQSEGNREQLEETHNWTNQRWRQTRMDRTAWLCCCAHGGVGRWQVE